MNFQEQISQLSNCKSTNLPFINLFLDSRKDESGKRYCDFYLKAKYDFIHYEFLLSGGDDHSFGRSWNMVKDILDNRLQDETKGLILILRPGPESELLFAAQLKVPLANRIIVDGIPQIHHLLELINEKEISKQKKVLQSLSLENQKSHNRDLLC